MGLQSTRFEIHVYYSIIFIFLLIGRTQAFVCEADLMRKKYKTENMLNAKFSIFKASRQQKINHTY